MEGTGGLVRGEGGGGVTVRAQGVSEGSDPQHEPYPQTVGPYTINFPISTSSQDARRQSEHYSLHCLRSGNGFQITGAACRFLIPLLGVISNQLLYWLWSRSFLLPRSEMTLPRTKKLNALGDNIYQTTKV